MRLISAAPLVAAAAASPASLWGRQSMPPPPAPLSGPVQGVATFNNYGTIGSSFTLEPVQTGQNCPSRGTLPNANTFFAATGDLSPNLTGVACPPAANPCDGSTPIPHCQQSNCGQCYKVTATHILFGDAVPSAGSVNVQIIDACPSRSPQNACQGSNPSSTLPVERCGQAGVNALDIDVSAFKTLTGLDPQNGLKDLNITIENC